MKTILSLLLASGLPLAACASNQSVDLELALGVADTQEGSLGAAQVGMIWYPAPRYGIEGWFGSSGGNPLDFVPGSARVDFNSWIDRMHGVGLRYRFFGDEQRRWQPFVRVGWAHADVHFEGVSHSYTGSDTYVLDRFEYEDDDEAVYYGIGSGFTLGSGWRLSAQVLHVPAEINGFKVGRTEALIGILYGF